MLKLPEEFEPFREQFESTRLEYIKIITHPSKELTRTQSKIGGYPYMPPGFEYPLDAQGQMMVLMTQINFSEVPTHVDYPNAGILQFFVENESALGEDFHYDFSSSAKQKNYRVIYHPQVIASITDEVNEEIPVIPTSADTSLHFEESFALTFEKSIDFIPLYGFDFMEYFRQFIDLRYFDFMEYFTQRFPDHNISHDKFEKLIDQYKTNVGQGFVVNKLGGYAFTIQEDPRTGTQTPYKQLLLLDSLAGVINFYIDPADLKALDFSKVVFYWSCG